MMDIIAADFWRSAERRGGAADGMRRLDRPALAQASPAAMDPRARLIEVDLPNDPRIYVDAFVSERVALWII